MLDGHMMGAAAVGAGHVTMTHLPNHARPESSDKSTRGWRTQPEVTSTSDRATHPTPRAPEYPRGMGLHGRAQSQAERMSQRGRATEMLEQPQ
ncbi:hypothetical protein PIB30_105022, partial [Stylosanthes scabra]|nr:hypothetical protein [Stylosanthes scabra]